MKKKTDRQTDIHRTEQREREGERERGRESEGREGGSKREVLRDREDTVWRRGTSPGNFGARGQQRRPRIKCEKM